MTNTTSLLILFAIIRPGLSIAQPENLVTVVAPETRLHEGETAKVQISVVVRDGYHIQANIVDDESLIPTSLVLDASENVIAMRNKFPRGKKLKLQGTETFLRVYDGKFSVVLFLTPTVRSQPGNYSLGARLQYQACDSQTCFFPRVLEFSIPVEILK